MNLSTHNKLAMLYRAFYNREQLPNNLCNYFWLTLLMLIFLPFVWPIIIINKFIAPFEWKEKDSWNNIFYYNPYYTRGYKTPAPHPLGFLINFVLFIVGLVCTKLFYKNDWEYMSNFKLYFNGIIAVIIGIIIITLFVKLLIYLSNLNPKSGDQKELEYKIRCEKDRLKSIKHKQSFRYLTWQRIIAWKENNCPIITWKNDKY